MANVRLRWRVVAASILALVAGVTPATPASPSPALAADGCLNGWRPVGLPTNLSAMAPMGAAAIDGQPAWIVGLANAGGSRAPLLAAWRDGGWQRVPGPWTGYGLLSAVGATAPDDAWTVGSIGSYTRWPISAHWDGTTWTAVSVPRPNGQLAAFADLAIVSSDDFWAVGARLTAGQLKPLAMRHRGQSWRVVNPRIAADRDGGLTDVTRAPGGRLWAAGWKTDAGRQSRPWVVYRSAGRWQTSALAPVVEGRAAVTALAFRTATDGWAGGFVETSGGGYVPLLQHWNGSTWTNVQLGWAAGRSILLYGVGVDASGQLAVAGMQSDAKRLDVLAALGPSGWSVTTLSPGTNGNGMTDNSAMMDVTPLASGTMAVGFFDKQPVTMLPCAEGTTGLTLSGDRSRLHAIEDQDEAEYDAMAAVASGVLAIPAVDLPGTGAVDMTAAAGLEMKSPTWGGIVADFDGNGYDDVFVTRHYQKLPRVMLNSASGTFSELSVSLPIRDRHGCDAADVDLDDTIDVLCAIGSNKGTSNTPNELLLDVANGGGTWATRQHGLLDGFGRGRDVTFLDLGRDRYPDAYVTNEPSRPDGLASSNRLYENVDGSGFATAPSWGVDRSMGGSCVTAADLDGDGDDELLVCTTEPIGGLASGVRLFVNEKGKFVDRTLALGVSAAHDVDVGVADFNGDGDLDLAQLTGRLLRVSLATGGTFLEAFELQFGAGVNMAIGDVNADGRPDIYVARRTGGNAGHLMLVNGGDGTSFTSMTIPQPSAGRADDVLAIDYDRNGRTDFVTLNGYFSSGPLKLTAFYPTPD